MASPIRREGMSRYRTITIAVLVVGGAVALLAGIVSSWPARFGLAVVVLAGWVAVTYAWREITETRLAGHHDLMTAQRRAYEALVAERAGNDTVVALLRDRSASLTTSLIELRGDLLVRQAELGERRSEISRLRGDNQSLRVDIRTLVERVDDLSGQIRVMESVVDVERVGAEVLSLPRRPMKHQRMLWSDDDVWTDDDLPSVVDLVRSDVVAQATSDVRRQA